MTDEVKNKPQSLSVSAPLSVGEGLGVRQLQPLSLEGTHLYMKHPSLCMHVGDLKVKSLPAFLQTFVELQTTYNYLNGFLLNDLLPL